MAQVRTLSFRDQTMGGVNDLLTDEGLTCAQSQNIIAYLAGELLAYREEGVSIAPIILYCERIDVALRSFPGNRHYQIGSKPLDVRSSRAILKDCASLTNSHWFIYIERTDDTTLTYGVASFESLPSSMSLLEGLALSDHTLAIVIQKATDKTIKIYGSKGSHLTCLFSTSREEASEFDAVQKFAGVCCGGIAEPEERMHFFKYFAPTLESLLQGSHGCILACSLQNPVSSIPELNDSIPLEPPIELFSAYMAFRADPSAANLASLQAYYGLIQGLLRSDGMVVFDSQARLIGFRAFYRPIGQMGISEEKGVAGGARRRAFEGARTLVGEQLSGLLFRSQDGLTLFAGSSE